VVDLNPAVPITRPIATRRADLSFQLGRHRVRFEQELLAWRRKLKTGLLR
jgi:hypothetical protein